MNSAKDYKSPKPPTVFVPDLPSEGAPALNSGLTMEYLKAIYGAWMGMMNNACLLPGNKCSETVGDYPCHSGQYRMARK